MARVSVLYNTDYDDEPSVDASSVEASARAIVGALAAALGHLLDDPALRTRLGAAGQVRVTARYGIAAMAEGTLACYGKAP